MKKIFIFLLMVATLAPLTSCKKEGVFNPKKKISKVYSSTNNQAKELIYSYTWNDKLLEKIEYLYISNAYEILDYDKDKRLIKRSFFSESWGYDYTEYTYTKGKLTNIALYRGDELLCEEKITHDGKKISKIECKDYYTDEFKSGKETNMKSALSTLFPDPIHQRAIHQMEKEITARMKTNAKGVQITTSITKLTWEKDNISKIETDIYDEDGVSEKRTYEYTYDDKKNPYYGFFGLNDYGYDANCGSKNNVITAKVTSTTYGTVTLNYTYSYDSDGYPTKSIDPYEETYYYEYE